jgi:hypothetical protein
MLRLAASAVLLAAIAAASPVRAQTHDIGVVFRDFESICFRFAESGYGVDVAYLIEEAGFKFVLKAKDGTDIFNSSDVQLVIGERACAFGMAQLPYDQMLQWTKTWVEARGLTFTSTSKTPKGGQYWQWSGMGFNIGLQDDKFPDGTPLTGLVLIRNK